MMRAAQKNLGGSQAIVFRQGACGQSIGSGADMKPLGDRRSESSREGEASASDSEATHVPGERNCVEAV
jgi:hypothetical protein